MIAIRRRMNHWRTVAHRLLPRAVLFVGLALVLVHHFRARPSTVDVVYEYGGAGQRLQAARVAYWQDGELVRQAQFNYQVRGAGITQRHQVQLREGDYTVELKLAYAGDPPPDVSGTQTRLVGGGSEVTVRRLLPVRGGGELHVHVVPGRER